MDGDAMRAVLDKELARFGEHAIDASMTLIAPDESAESMVVAALSEQDWDVVVIGGGIRKPEPLVTFFEQVVNLVRRHAPYVREVAPHDAYAIHDGALNDIGTAMVGGFLGDRDRDRGPGVAARYHRLTSGATAQIG
ncbi:hypothetical protein [Streptomyces sp. NPDC090798]|uniref:hypothetical protein n=1 Tax=Streptomyces sp. NPDC090798 TaxID=3365968 RepID=UPI0038249F29